MARGCPCARDEWKASFEVVGSAVTRTALQAFVFATPIADFAGTFACVPSEPPGAAASTGPAANEPPSLAAWNQNPKDDPASCVDAELASGHRWNEAQRRELDAQLATSTTCYQAALKENAALEGKLRLFLHYDKNQKTPKVDIAASSISDCQLAACLQRLAGTVPPHAASPKTSFTYTLEFKQRSLPSRPKSEPVFSGEHCVQKTASDGGRLPPAAIQSIIREHYGKFRACYERGLARDPTLSGRINVRFVIARDGSVSSAAVSDNEIPDCDVAGCLLPVYRSLKFPKPEGGGVVTVVYPIMFAPG